MNPKQLGILGERITLNYLKNKGYKILDKNYSPGFVSGPKRGEIDIVAKRGDIISFVEVKTLISQSNENLDNSRSRTISTESFSPEERVDYLKQKKLIKTAQSWLMEKKISSETKWQIDVLAIKIDLNSKKAKIRHLKNITY